MTSSLSRQSFGRFHEMPLVLFSSLAIVGAGLLAGHFLAWAFLLAPLRPSRWQAGMGVILLAAGLGLSLLHLGRPLRMLYAFRALGRSLLSAEVFLASVMLGASAAATFLPLGESVEGFLFGVVAFAAPSFLLSLGWVYRLRGQLSWKGPASLSPLLMGLAFGLLVRASLEGGDTACIRLAFALLVLDAAAFGIRWYAMRWDASLGNPSHPVLFRARRRVMMVRLVDVNLLPVLFLLAQTPIPAAGFLVIGILLDRYAFYALSLRQTTESEVARVNDHLCKKSENP